MKCYHCGQNEAEYGFVVHMMGNTAEIYLCGECLSSFQQHIALMMRYPEVEEAAPVYFGEDSSPQLREWGGDPFPLDAGEEFKQRRILKELKARLREAVEQEEYELAAELRDEIRKKEEGVFVYGT